MTKDKKSKSKGREMKETQIKGEENDRRLPFLILRTKIQEEEK